LLFFITDFIQVSDSISVCALWFVVTGSYGLSLPVCRLWYSRIVKYELLDTDDDYADEEEKK